ncbi:MAG: hypothetical protein ACREJK_11115, partial [Candidatus Methylomirabilales bacterium]
RVPVHPGKKISSRAIPRCVLATSVRSADHGLRRAFDERFGRAQRRGLSRVVIGGRSDQDRVFFDLLKAGRDGDVAGSDEGQAPPSDRL